MYDANSQTRMTHSCRLGRFVQNADFPGEEKQGLLPSLDGGSTRI